MRSIHNIKSEKIKSTKDLFIYIFRGDEEWLKGQTIKTNWGESKILWKSKIAKFLIIFFIFF